MILPRCLVLAFFTLGVLHAQTAPADWPVIQRRGDQLFEGTRPFRFLGLDAPNLHQNESQLALDGSNRFPDEFEIRDTLSSLHQLGARATRTFSLSLAHPDDHATTYILRRREYNEDAFRALDRVLALCHEYDIRIIIPLIASQNFSSWRGVDTFSAFAGKGPGTFFTDADVKADFRHLVDFLANRKNTVSGLLYRDDPAILGWQLGNEYNVYAPDRKQDAAYWQTQITAWSKEMAAYIKSVDPRHLVIEAGGDRDILLEDPNIDVISTHLYEYWNRLMGQPTDLAMLARRDAALCRGKRPLVIDEFGLGSVSTVRQLIHAIREENVIAGGLLWSVRSHRREGGFYYHNEGGTPINSYHFPGFSVGNDYQETQLLDLLRNEAFAIRGLPVPAREKPSPAPVLQVAPDGGFVWRGSTGASRYEVERSDTSSGPWQQLVDSVQDSIVCDVKTYEATGGATPPALWHDEQAQPGHSYYYRVRGVNVAGFGQYSEPIKVEVK